LKDHQALNILKTFTLEKHWHSEQCTVLVVFNAVEAEKLEAVIPRHHRQAGLVRSHTKWLLMTQMLSLPENMLLYIPL
jgi:hypothetical protein